MDQSTYYLFAVIASSSALLIALVTLWHVRRQLRTALRNREADLVMKLYAASTTPDMDKPLAAVWALNGAAPQADQRPHCERACVFFELLGTLVHQNYTGTAIISSFFGSLVTGSYNKLQAYIGPCA